MSSKETSSFTDFFEVFISLASNDVSEGECGLRCHYKVISCHRVHVFQFKIVVEPNLYPLACLTLEMYVYTWRQASYFDSN